jgi:hypothetical protein
MGRLATWSSRGLLALWLAWFGLLFGLFILHVRHVHRQWQSQPSPVVSAESASVALPPGQRLTVLPEQHTDFVYSLVLDTKTLLKTLLILVGPPGIATALWYAQQRRHRGPPP